MYLLRFWELSVESREQVSYIKNIREAETPKGRDEMYKLVRASNNEVISEHEGLIEAVEAFAELAEMDVAEDWDFYVGWGYLDNKGNEYGILHSGCKLRQLCPCGCNKCVNRFEGGLKCNYCYHG